MRALIAILAASSLLVAAPAARANHYNPDSNLYSYKRNKDCAKRYLVDPITVIFYGSAALTRVLAGYERGGPFRKDVKGNVTLHTKWTRHNTDNIFRQDGRTDHGCVVNPGDTDLASASGYGNDRWHLRMWPMRMNAPAGEPFYVSTTPHKEDWYWGDSEDNKNDCGTGPGTGSHAVERGAVDRQPKDYERHGSGFDRGRRFLWNAYGKGNSPRHKAWVSDLGNTRSVKQCDGEWAGSNGNVAFIGVGKNQ